MGHHLDFWIKRSLYFFYHLSKAVYNVVFLRVLLSWKEGTLLASAPSYPDVLAFKRTGSGLQPLFPHCI